MAFNKDLSSYESTWMNDSYARERAYNESEERDLSDWQEEDAALLDQARKEAAEHTPRIAYAACDGSGIAEEYYIDVDQTHIIPCPGCIACDLELVEFRGRKPISAEGAHAERKVA